MYNSFSDSAVLGIHMKLSILFFIAHLSPVLKMMVVSKIRRCYLLSFYHLHRSEAYAISRNMEEVDSEKKSSILPKGEMPTVSSQHFQSSEIFSRARSWEVTRPVLQAGREQIASQIPRESLQGSAEAHSLQCSLASQAYCWHGMDMLNSCRKTVIFQQVLEVLLWELV